jgi:hypothetical protein
MPMNLTTLGSCECTVVGRERIIFFVQRLDSDISISNLKNTNFQCHDNTVTFSFS